MEDKIKTAPQMIAAFAFYKAFKADYVIVEKDFSAACGVGINVTTKDIEKGVAEVFTKHKAEILSKKHEFNFNVLLHQIRETFKWGDGGEIVRQFNAKKLELVGEKPKEEKKKVKAAPKPKPTEESKDEELDMFADFKKDKLSTLVARDVNTAINTEELLKKHKDFTKGRILTRFPPEPNGYLHIGHAKAMRFSFTIASEYGGETYLRYDDTNPEKENQEYIDSIADTVKWLGYKPWQTTFSSDHF